MFQKKNEHDLKTQKRNFENQFSPSKKVRGEHSLSPDRKSLSPSRELDQEPSKFSVMQKTYTLNLDKNSKAAEAERERLQKIIEFPLVQEKEKMTNKQKNDLEYQRKELQNMREHEFQRQNNKIDMWKSLTDERQEELRDKLVACRRENHLKCDHQN